MQFDVSKQLPSAQRQVGVAFGQQAAGGFNNAHYIGIGPAASSPDLVAWPLDYRLGLIDGLLINPLGRITLASWFADDIPKLLEPMKWSEAVRERLEELAGKVEESQWESSLRDDIENRKASVEIVRSGAVSLFAPARKQIERVCSILER